MNPVPEDFLKQGITPSIWRAFVRKTERNDLYELFQAFLRLNGLCGAGLLLALESIDSGSIIYKGGAAWLYWSTVGEGVLMIEQKIKEKEMEGKH